MRDSFLARASIAAMALALTATAVGAQDGRTAPPHSIATLPGAAAPIDLRADGEPLREVLDRLGEVGGFRVRFAGREGLAREPVRLTAARATVGEALTLLAEAHQLRFLRRGIRRVLAFGRRSMPEGHSQPRVLRQVDPEYNDTMLADCVDGAVWFEGVVTARGKVRELTLVRPLHPDAHAVARRAVRQWRFAPAVRDGEPIAIPAVFTVTFRLLDEQRARCDEAAGRS